MAKKMMMLIDPSRCTGCRACQVACKQWNENKAVKTTFTGSYQNPPDFDGETFTVVRFREQDNGKPFGVYWLMTNDKCRHCAEPTCLDGFDSEDAYFVDKHGAVVYTEKAKGDLESVREMCPFNVPRQNENGQIVKCTLCADRLSYTGASHMEHIPACAKACPTGAILWGEYDDTMDYAAKRIKWLKARDNGRVNAAEVKLYPPASFGSHVRWILIGTRDEHGLVGDV